MYTFYHENSLIKNQNICGIGTYEFVCMLTGHYASGKNEDAAMAGETNQLLRDSRPQMA